MQPSNILLLLGCVAVANSFGLDLRFLSPWRSSDESNERQVPPISMCKPKEPMTLIRSTREAQLLRNDLVPLPTLAPANNPGDFSTRRLVPLPTLVPTSTSTPSTRQVIGIEGDRKVANPSNDCEPHPMGIGTRLSSQLLKILTVLG